MVRKKKKKKIGIFITIIEKIKVNIVGYARSKMSDEEFRKNIAKYLGSNQNVENFLNRCHYFIGSYDNEEDFAQLDKNLRKLEGKPANRIFYFAIPPSIFLKVANSIQPAVNPSLQH